MPGMVFDGAVQNNPAFQERGLDYMTLPWGDALAASVKDTFIHNPTQEVGALSELEYAQHPAVRSFFDNFATSMAEANGDTGQLRTQMEGQAQKEAADGSDKFIDPHTLNQKYGKSLGLSFDKPERAGAVAILARRRAEQIDLDARLAHGPDGLAYQGTRLLTSLAVGATDPLNIAASFVPVVGETRAGLWAERFGKFGARALEGGIEGAVGQAILEPINIATENAYHNNYGPMDAFMNVAFGTILGGGLHTGFGALSDLMGRLSPETREQTLRAAVAQMAEGRDVDVAHVIYSDASFRQIDQMPVLRDLKFASDEARLTGEHATLTEQVKALPAGDVTARDRLAQLEVVERDLKNPDTSVEDRRTLTQRRDEILTDTNPESLRAAAQPLEDKRNLENRLSSLESDLAKVRTDRLSLKVEDALTPGPLRAIADTAAQRISRMGDTEATIRQNAPQFARETDSQVRQSIDAARSNTLDNSRGQKPSSASSPNASKAADETVKLGQGDDLGAELQEANSRLAQYQAQGILTPEEIEHVKASDVTEAANTRSKAADAAAICLNLHP